MSGLLRPARFEPPHRPRPRRGVFGSRILRWAAALALLSPAAQGAADGEAVPSPGAHAVDRVTKYTDLLRLAEHHQERVEGRRARLAVWDLDGHYRPAVVQSPSSTSRLGPIEAGRRCRLHFGTALGGDQKAGAAAVRFRASVQQGDLLQLLVDEPRDPAAQAGKAWSDHVVDLPVAEGRPFHVILEARAEASPEGAEAPPAGWSAPYVTCEIPREAPRQRSHPHVILISLDTLRADHLGAYGYERGTSPVLDAFAQESLVFENAFSTAPWTLPSHASMFTGLHPDQHRAGHASPLDPLGDGPPTLAEGLRDAGYLTIAFTAGGMMSSKNGLHRGFQWWTQRTRANLAASLPGVFDAIAAPPAGPIFLVLHTYDIHGPYAYLPGLAPPHSLAPATKPSPGEAAKEWARARGIPYHGYQKLERFEGFAEVVDAYDAGIRFVDAQLGVFFDRLRDVGIYDDALIIVTSDHGESLYERNDYIGHSYSLKDEEVRIPLLVRLPGSPMRGRVSELVSLVDLMPLILDVAGVETNAELAGTNPLRRIAGVVDPSPHVRGEAAHTGARFVRSRRWKLIGAALSPGDPNSELPKALADRADLGPQAYDLAADPREEANLIRGESALAESLRPLEAVLEGMGRPAAGGGATPDDLSPERIEELRALGYLP